VLLPQPPQAIRDNLATRLADDVADKKQLQHAANVRSPQPSASENA
jgi:hypothetical protein